MYVIRGMYEESEYLICKKLAFRWEECCDSHLLFEGVNLNTQVL
jgi:hypothetical protein